MKNHAVKALAFCGISCAIASIIIFLTGVVGFASLGLTALAGCALSPVILKYGWKYGLISYAATSAVCMLIAPDKYAAFLFVAFFGFYPVVKDRIEKIIHSHVFSTVIKLIIFNGCFAIDAFLIGKLFAVSIFTAYPVILVIMGANFIFLCYDYAFTMLLREAVRRLGRYLQG